jgi:hypothetical protein
VIFALIALTLMPKWVWGDAMEQQFVSPPNSAKPRVWWHWMDGNVTKEGIEADLLWMKRVGIGGVHQVDAGLNTAQLVKNRLGYMTPQWKKAFRFGVDQAAKLDLEFGIFSSPGWSITGGPWVKPEQAMKKLVWSETAVKGGTLFKAKLPALPIATGPFQNVSRQQAGGLVGWDPTRPLPEYNKDTAVIAYRVPVQHPVPPILQMTSNVNLVDAVALTDGNAATELMLPAPQDGKPPWIQMEYGTPLEVRSITVSVSPPGSVVNLAVSDNGKKYKTLRTFYIGSTSQATVAIEPVTARFFRFSLHSPKPLAEVFTTTSAPGVSRDLSEKMFSLGMAPPPLVVHDLLLRQGARVNQFEQKAGFEMTSDYYAIDTPPVPKQLVVPKGDVVDITEFMLADGTLQWQAPAGDWVVLRMGYSLTGSLNHAASREGTGLEVDKLNKQHVAEYLNSYLKQYTDTVGSSLIGKRGLNAFMTDSLEVGVQNWTDDMLKQFERLRGYDPRPWLPSLTGIVIESAEQSDKFLWDFRKTIADLMLENHYKQIADTVRGRGLTLYGEALESYRYSLGDDMDFRRYTDVPTAAMWIFSPTTGPGAGYIVDIMGAASVAHIYGQNLVGAESLTSALAPWASSPRDLKPIADLEFALGVNRPIIHTSAHQPRNDMVPGFSLSIFGQYFNRHETWAEQAKGWIDYLSRSSYLLQQGQYVADIAYFYGEEAPLTALFGTSSPPGIPAGYSFDFINADGILNHLSVEDGGLVTPSGMHYRLLYLGGSSARMTLPVLRKLRTLVEAGGVIVGAKPHVSPSLTDDAAEFHRVADDIWGTGDVQNADSRSVKLGQVFRGPDAGTALAKLNVPKDFEYAKADSHTELMFQHRRIANGHIYFVSNRSNRKESVEATFRVNGKQAELWHADTGVTEKTSFRIEDNLTIVPLVLDPYQSVFVIFRESTSKRALDIKQPEKSIAATLDGNWRLSLPSQGSIPASTKVLELGSWSEQQDKSVRYFSGTGTYLREFSTPENWLEPGARLILDLGDVRELAEVNVNGQALGVLWKPPYTVEITDALLRGRNTLEVKVTNLWVNRLIGDQQPGVTPFTFTSAPTYRADAPLRSSGLIGPVTIEKLISH